MTDDKKRYNLLSYKYDRNICVCVCVYWGGGVMSSKIAAKNKTNKRHFLHWELNSASIRKKNSGDKKKGTWDETKECCVQVSGQRPHMLISVFEGIFKVKIYFLDVFEGCF